MVSTINLKNNKIKILHRQQICQTYKKVKIVIYIYIPNHKFVITNLYPKKTTHHSGKLLIIEKNKKNPYICCSC